MVDGGNTVGDHGIAIVDGRIATVTPIWMTMAFPWVTVVSRATMAFTLFTVASPWATMAFVWGTTDDHDMTIVSRDMAIGEHGSRRAIMASPLVAMASPGVTADNRRTATDDHRIAMVDRGIATDDQG